MIIKKWWFATKKCGWKANSRWQKEGWFLFGIIPLYVRDVTIRGL